MNQWDDMSKKWAEWGPPLRPTLEDVNLFKSQLPQKADFLLGVTPELQNLAETAIDNNPQAIEIHQAKAILADWREAPIRSASASLIIGDGSLNVLDDGCQRFFPEMQRILKSKGKLILRVFVSPENRDSLDQVLKEKDSYGFHAFKWKVAQALANPFVAVKTIYETILPVRNHPTLEVYKNSDAIYFFPKLSELPPYQQITYPISYELAERCPTITWEF